jgi:hypothetical protein
VLSYLTNTVLYNWNGMIWRDQQAEEAWMDLVFELIRVYKSHHDWENPFGVLDSLFEYASIAEATIAFNGLASWYGKTESIGISLAECASKCTF